MTSEELGDLFAEYREVVEDLGDKDTAIVQGLKELKQLHKDIASYGEPRSSIPRRDPRNRSYPNMDDVTRLSRKLTAYWELKDKKLDLEDRLDRAGYGRFKQPTP